MNEEKMSDAERINRIEAGRYIERLTKALTENLAIVRGQYGRDFIRDLEFGEVLNLLDLQACASAETHPMAGTELTAHDDVQDRGRVGDLIRQLFHESLQKQKTCISRSLSSTLDTLIDAIGVEVEIACSHARKP